MAGSRVQPLSEFCLEGHHAMIMSTCVRWSKAVLFAMCSISFVNSACIKKKSDSDASTVLIPHSPAGDQGKFGNCWAFATLGWVESFAKSIVLQTSEKNPDLNFSEAYLTYRNIETMLANPSAGAEHIEGQSVSDAIALVLKHGVMFEKDFLPGAHPDTPESSQVCGGLFRLKQSLQLGTFGDRSPGNIRAKLDEAFGVKMASLEKKVYSAESLVLWRDQNNKANTLAGYLKSLKGYSLPGDAVQLQSVLRSSNVSEDSPNTFPVSSANQASTFSEETRRVVRNMRWSMNDGYPVLLDTYVDFSAYDQTAGIFSFLNIFDANGKRKPSGQTGYHALVAVDYTASGVAKMSDGSLVPFETKEGEETKLNRRMAVAFGDNITNLIAVNSWGNVGYTFDGRKGYIKLTGDYLFAWHKPQKQPERFLRKIFLLDNFATNQDPPPFTEP